MGGSSTNPRLSQSRARARPDDERRPPGDARFISRLLAFVLGLGACAAPPPGTSTAPASDGLLRQMRACLEEAKAAPPCTLVEPSRGFVVIKDDDPAKPYAWLLVPSTDVTGIEDPAVFRAPVLGFWAVGWSVGAELVPAPPERRALAINSKAGRSQNLLHIHVSCVAHDVAAALAAAEIGPDWAQAPFIVLAGRTWNARRVGRLDPSPFLLLSGLPGAAEDMGAQSLAVVGGAGGGFVLLADATRPGAPAEAEALLDERCR